MEQEIGLGWKVKDRITGLEGIVNHVVFYAGSGPVAGVAPCKLNKDGEVGDVEMFDFTQVEVLDRTPLFPIPEKKPFTFEFGDKVRDTITGFEGRIAGMAHYINGCNRILVRPPYMADQKEGKARTGEFLAEAMLEKVEAAKKEVKEKATSEKTRGGPAEADSSAPYFI